MASPQVNPASHRKLKTYGKSSRHVPYAASPSPSTLARPKAQDSDRSGSLKTVKPTESTRLQKDTEADARKRKEDHRMNRTQPVSLSKLSRPSASRQTSDRSQDASVYDFSSSGDELSMDLSLHRKRRRIGETNARWSPGGLEETTPRKFVPNGSPVNGRAKDSEKEKAVSPPKSASKLSSCEVVIHTKSVTPSPLKAKETMKLAYRKHSSPETQSTTKMPSKVEASLSSRLARPLKSLRKASPTRTSAPKRFEDLESLHEEMLPMSPSRRPKPMVLNGGNRSTPERRLQKQDSIRSTATPSRRRLVDALITHTSEEESELRSSSPLERESKSPEVISRRNLLETNGSVSNPRRRSATSAANPPPMGPKVTYARQRSFLSVASQSGDVDPLLASTESLLGPSPAIGGKSKGTSSSKDVFSLPDDEELGTGNGIRNIYELRRAGGNARFEGVIDSIFEDLEDSLSSRSGRWRALFQLCTKLTEYPFARRFLDNSLEKRLAGFCTEKEDVICQYLVASAFTLLLLTGQISSVALHTCCTQILKLAPLLLPQEDDILTVSKQQNPKLPRMDRTALQNVLDKLQQSKIWEGADSPPPATPQIMALRCIDLAVRRVRETGSTLDVMSNTTLSQVVRLLLRYSALEEADGVEMNPFSILEMSCSILESYTVSGDALDQEKENIVRRLSKLGPLLSRLSLQSSSEGRQILILGIRLILNLTNNKPSLCDDFSTREIITALVGIVSSSFRMVAEDIGSDRKDSLLDTVILALGALINLTEWSATPRRLMLELRLDSGTFLDCLIHLFKDGLEAVSEADSVIQTHSNVAFGYLSVLLSTLSLDNDVRAHIRSSLNGKGLHRLLETVNEFAHYHRKVEEELQDESMSGFTSRLQGIVDRIQRAESGHH